MKLALMILTGSRVIAGPLAANLVGREMIAWNPSTPDRLSMTIELTTSNNRDFHGKRDVTLSRGLQAVWTFHCANTGGSDTRTFQWGVHAVSTNTNKVTVVGIMHIDAFVDTVIQKKDFSAYYIHKYCTPRGKKACSYKFRAQTTGWIDAYGLHLQMITLSNKKWENPVVVEQCVDLPEGPHTAMTCPVISPPVTTPCTITDLAVTTINV